MKKLFEIAVIVFSLGVLLAACGGSSKKTNQPQSLVQSEAKNTVQVATKVVVSPTVTSKAVDQFNNNITGKTCPTGDFKVTSNDLTEAVVNTICRIFGTDVFRRDQLIDSLTITTENNGDRVEVVFTTSLQNCDGCPTVFSGNGYFTKNPLGEWQQTDIFRHQETQASIDARLVRERQKGEVEGQKLVSQVRLSLLSDKVLHDSSKPYILVNLQADLPPGTTFKLLGQLDDGRLVEFSDALLCTPETRAYAGGSCASTLPMVPFDQTASWGLEDRKYETLYYSGEIKIIAYKASTVSGGGIVFAESDWIYFNK